MKEKIKISFLGGLKPTAEQYAQAVAEGAKVVFALSELDLASENAPFINLSGIKIRRASNLVSLQIKEFGLKVAGFSSYGEWIAEKNFDVITGTGIRLDLLVILILQKDKISDEHLIALRAAEDELKIPIFALNSSGQYKIIGARSKKDKGIIYFNI